MVAVALSVMFLNFYQTSWHCIPEDTNFHSHNCQNLKI